jgi:hypothetical protein
MVLRDVSGGGRWVWVSLPGRNPATFALCVRDGRVTDGPPYAWGIVRRLGTDDWRKVADHLVQRKAVFAELPEPGVAYSLISG